MNNNKIILITHEYPPQRGGAGVYCEEIDFAASKQSIDLEIWAPAGTHINDGGKVKKMPHKGSQDWSCSWSLFQFLRKNRFPAKYWHIADPGSLRAMIRFGWLLSNLPPLILTIHGSELLRFTRFRAERILFRRLLKRAKKIHVLSRYNEERLKKFCPESSQNIHRIPGAPARRVLSIEHNTSENKEKQSKDTITLLCVGRIHLGKGNLN